MVQEATSYLMNVPGPEGVMQAQEKVTEALAAQDQEGVDVDKLRQAQSALVAGDIAAATSGLGDSITEAAKSLPPAKGLDTGTGVLLPPLETARLSGPAWLFLAVSVLAVAGGTWLAVLFRPYESLRELRRQLGPTSGRSAGGDGNPDGGAR